MGKDTKIPGQPLEAAGGRPELWTTYTLKARLLESVSGKLPRMDEVPTILRLNSTWTNVLDDVFFMPTTQTATTLFYEEHPEENLRLLKTDADRKKVLVQTTNQMGAHDHVRFSTQGLIHGREAFLGVFHKHPVEANFSTEDIVRLLVPGGEIIAGLVDPQNYYLTFRTQSTPVISDLAHIARGYLLGVGRKHGATITTHSQGIEGFTMTAPMFKELGLPIYIGNRGQDSLRLVST